MKTRKKILGFCTALLLVFTTAMSAWAATVTVSYGSGSHTYVAYQVFTGNQDENGYLGDIQWGDGINSAGFLKDSDLPDLAGTITEKTGAEDIAKVAAGFTGDNSSKADKLAKLLYKYKIDTKKIDLQAGDNTLAAGYYLIVDTTDLSNTTDDATNMALLQLTDTITIGQKTGVPTVTLKVYEESLETYNDLADASIGDDITYRITATVPKEYTNYDSYKLIFHVAQDAGLVADTQGIKVVVADSAGNEKTVGSDYWKLNTVSDNDAFCLEITDVSQLKDDKGNAISVTKDTPILLYYTAQLATGQEENVSTKAAAIGDPGNETRVTLEYSSNPNNGNQTSKTTQDQVVVYSYELDIHKVDKDDTSINLKGVQFYLRSGVYDKDKKDYAFSEKAQEATGTPEATESPAATESPKATEAPASTESPNQNSQNGEEDQAQTSMYAVVDANGVLTGWTDSKSQATVLTTDEDGMLQISGLDEGTYFLQETQAKSGYNTPEDPFRITISAPTDEAVNNYGETKDAYTLGTVTVSVDKGDAVDGASGVVTAQILNGKGTLLPTTGGKGVWILYGVGAALVAVAAFLQYRSRRS